MRRIERLPEAVHSSVRSGIVICDLTRIVEELVFNSLDAGATKVSVAVGAGSCYIIVVDNGSGITRDGLVLLGERNATSKIDNFTVTDGTVSFGFKGEVLGSISDVSLLEIVTKARGRPNGYRKVMKGCKCLHLGINDERQDVGTTVIVRDIFYNQPVRRKHIQSRPEKVLDSIKKCVLRIALVHLDVSFKVNDIDSEDELLCTEPSPSPLPILSNNFRIEVSSSLSDLSVSDGVLKLSGCISGPSDIFSPKAIQYVYINSRFICKGPIHKLLNQLAARFDSLNSWKPSTGSQKGKRNRCQICPLFILNLSCPISHYDIITFEQSKTSVEFKDWAPVLTFIENAITCLWSKNFSDEKYMAGTCQSGRRTFKNHNFGTSAGFPSAKLKNLPENCDNIPAWKECISSRGNPHVSEGKRNKRETGFVCHTDCLSQSRDGTLADCGVAERKDSSTHPSSCNALSVEHHDFVRDIDEQLNDILCSGLEDVFPKIDANMNKVSKGRVLLDDCLESSDDADVRQDPGRSFLRSCYFQRSLLNDRPSLASDEEFEFGSDDFNIEQKCVEGDDRVVNEINQKFYGKSLKRDGSPVFQSSPRTPCRTLKGSECLSGDLVNSSLSARNSFNEKNHNPPDIFRQGWKYGPSQQSLSPGSFPVTSEPKLETKFKDDDFTDIHICENHFKFGGDATYDYSTRTGEDCIIAINNIKENMHLEKYSFMNSSPDLKDCADHRREHDEFYGFNLEDSYSPSPLKRFRETDWSSLPSCSEKRPTNFSVPSTHYTLSANDKYGKPCSRNQETMSAIDIKKSSRRSKSAPPFYRGKQRFLTLSDPSTMVSGEINSQTSDSLSFLPESSNLGYAPHCAETSNLKDSLISCDQYDPSSFQRSETDISFVKRQRLKRTPETHDFQDCKLQKTDQSMSACNMKSVECFTLGEILDTSVSGRKWRNDSQNIAGGDLAHNFKDQDHILDIFSGILHLAGDSLVPKSIDKSSLEDAKVLNQVDKKFIVVVAGRSLAVIDQHAADERIRLEELRSKVLSGEMKTITYLNAEQTLKFECSTQAANCCHTSCGVDLTDVHLLEFLQQLAETDGSSTIPPAVHQILNNKACRGAIMFGDSLLPSECSLIVEELKRTSLCFQCAHGRPTTVPLVELDVLHNLIAKLGSCSSGSQESWHGLRQHGLSLERARKRLNIS
ncbi:DNA mismatch repair protein MLH3 isoform X2 [Olea europaea var. sylvestris]|uniref:DNA mismatch repair protein MLH3 isoform X2 n=1 Tax=Olea europaea var. sylvestris TaxID=158386 RepID=UPI000C1D0EA1|nr:DNA mismatch repair protein MLH3 isoform X2 [Olea europaea var. sylvestris]